MSLGSRHDQRPTERRLDGTYAVHGDQGRRDGPHHRGLTAAHCGLNLQRGLFTLDPRERS